MHHTAKGTDGRVVPFAGLERPPAAPRTTGEDAVEGRSLVDVPAPEVLLASYFKALFPAIWLDLAPPLDVLMSYLQVSQLVSCPLCRRRTPPGGCPAYVS